MWPSQPSVRLYNLNIIPSVCPTILTSQSSVRLSQTLTLKPWFLSVCPTVTFSTVCLSVKNQYHSVHLSYKVNVSTVCPSVRLSQTQTLNPWFLSVCRTVTVTTVCLSVQNQDHSVRLSYKLNVTTVCPCVYFFLAPRRRTSTVSWRFIYVT
jgi:ABC-type polysaccharide transport system permease subunit